MGRHRLRRDHRCPPVDPLRRTGVYRAGAARRSSAAADGPTARGSAGPPAARSVAGALRLRDARSAGQPGPPPRADPWIEVGALWQPGEAQPAWAELLRARRYLVESNGRGTLRAFVPLPLGSVDPQQAGSSESARVAWNAAWPVLRHVVATELARREADEALTIEVHAYDHRPAQTVFVLGTRPHRAELTGAAADGSRPPLNLAAWQGLSGVGPAVRGRPARARQGSIVRRGDRTACHVARATGVARRSRRGVSRGVSRRRWPNPT